MVDLGQKGGRKFTFLFLKKFQEKKANCESWLFILNMIITLNDAVRIVCPLHSS